MLVKKKRMIAAILALSFVKMSMGAVTPVLASIALVFPDASHASVAALATLPTLLGIPCSIISGRIVGRRIKYKSIAMFGLSILVISGIMPYFAKSMTELLIWRGAMGIGLGVMTPLAPSITINTLSHDEAEKQIGWNGLVSNIGAIFFQLIAGIISVYSWNLGFLTYILVIPIWIIVMLNFHEPEINHDEKAVKTKFTSDMKKSLVLWCLLSAAFSLLFYTVISDLSGIIMNNGYGSSGESGFVFSVLSAGGVLGSYLLKTYVTKLEKLIVPAGAVICGIGFTILAIGQNLVMMFIGAGIIGIGFGIYSPAIILFGSMGVAPENRPFAVSCIAASNALSGFLSAYVFLVLRNIFSAESDQFSIGISAAVFFIISILFLVLYFRTIKNRNTESFKIK